MFIKTISNACFCWIQKGFLQSYEVNCLELSVKALPKWYTYLCLMWNYMIMKFNWKWKWNILLDRGVPVLFFNYFFFKPTFFDRCVFLVKLLSQILWILFFRKRVFWMKLTQSIFILSQKYAKYHKVLLSVKSHV